MKTDQPDNKKMFSRQVGEKEKRKLRAQAGNKPSVWSGLGLFGMIGWSVTMPALMGTAIGIWLDKKHPEGFSWTLTFLIIGLAAGCVIAWNWIEKENKEIHKNEDQEDE